MAANNEIGLLHPMKEIAEISHKVGAYLHSDAAQAVGKITVDVKDWDVDLLSISGHKIYGPKGIGAIYIRKRPRIAINPLMDGGGQERGMRSGTLAPALCVGLGKACEIAQHEGKTEENRLRDFRNYVWQEISSRCPQVELNGDMENRLAGNLNITIPGAEIAEVMAALDGLSVSGGSACSSGGGNHSHVLTALGHDPARIAAGLRIGLGRFTTQEEVVTATEMLVSTISKLAKP